MQLNIDNIKHYPLVFMFIGLYFISGCSSPKSQPASGISQMPRLESQHFISDDGYRLPISGFWPSPAAKGIVIALHGFNDYSKAFAPMCQSFAERDMACIAYDQRGFGATQMRGIWPQVGRLQKDLHVIVELLHKQNPTLPVFLAGESMGGAVILTAMADSSLTLEKDVQGVILYAPAVWARSTQPWYQRLLLWISVHTFPSWTLTGQWLGIQATDNTEALKAMRQDDNIIKATRIDALYGLTNLMDRSMLAAKNVSINTLVLYGEKDEVIPKKPTCVMLEQMRKVKPSVFFKHYPNGYHMLTRDIQADSVFADSLIWMLDFQLETQPEHEQFLFERLSKERSIGYCDK